MRHVVTVTTNVPGPGQPLYGMGRRLLEIISYVPFAAEVRTGVAIFSYCGRLTLGITGDFAASPDLDGLARGIEHGVAELLAAVRRRHRQAAAAGRRPPRLARNRPAGPQAVYLLRAVYAGAGGRGRWPGVQPCGPRCGPCADRA
jgi:hypothetical protein